LFHKILATAAVCVLAAALAISISLRRPRVAMAASTAVPAYAKNGDLLPIANYREWTYLSSGFDPSSSPKDGQAQEHATFDNVFVNPAAYRSFLETGAWPDKTVIVLERREARNKGSICQNGHFQGKTVAGFEVQLKDEARFPGKWAFFTFDSPDSNGTLMPQGASCVSCHAAHGAVDSTYVQFDPTLLPVARKKGTLSEAFLKEESAAAAKK